jgi:hypothetical protein
MNNEMKLHTETYMVIDDHGMARSYCSVLSVRIEDKRLILRSEHGNIIASFSSWSSSSIWPTPDCLVTEKENTEFHNEQRKKNYEAAVKNECPILRGYP